MRRGAYTGHRARRPMIKVTCPACEVTIDTPAGTWITCPACEAMFNRRTGDVIPAPTKDDLEE